MNRRRRRRGKKTNQNDYSDFSTGFSELNINASTDDEEEEENNFKIRMYRTDDENSRRKKRKTPPYGRTSKKKKRRVSQGISQGISPRKAKYIGSKDEVLEIDELNEIKKANRRQETVKKIPNIYREKVLRETLRYYKYAYSPIFRLVRDIAGKTEIPFEDFLARLPPRAEGFITAYSLGTEEKALMGIYCNMYVDLFKHLRKLEVIHNYFGTVGELKEAKANLEKIPVPEEEEEEGVKNFPRADIELKTKRKYLKNLVQMKTKNVQDAGEVYEEIIKSPPPSPTGKRRGFMKSRIGSQSVFDDSDEDEEEEEYLGHFHKGVNKFLHVLDEIKEVFEDGEIKTTKMMSSLVPKIREDIPSICSELFDIQTPRLIGNTLRGETSLKRGEWYVEENLEKAFNEKIQKSVYYHLRDFRKNLKKEKLYKRYEFGLPIEFSDVLTSRIREGVEKVKGYCGSDDIQIKHIIEQDNISILFSDLVSNLIKRGGYDRKTIQGQGSRYRPTNFKTTLEFDIGRVAQKFLKYRFQGGNFAQVRFAGNFIGERRPVVGLEKILGFK